MSADPRTRWGWHRLADPWARRIVAEAGIRRGDLVLDIGAGTGALTSALLDVGARVVAVELHAGRAAELRRRFEGERVTVVRADAADLRLPRRPFRVVANPPFAVETAIVKRLLAPGTRLVAARIVLPRHAAARWATRSGNGAGRWRRDYDLAVVAELPRGAFRPPPPSPVAVLAIERRIRAREYPL